MKGRNAREREGMVEGRVGRKLGKTPKVMENTGKVKRVTGTRSQKISECWTRRGLKEEGGEVRQERSDRKCVLQKNTILREM